MSHKCVCVHDCIKQLGLCVIKCLGFVHLFSPTYSGVPCVYVCFWFYRHEILQFVKFIFLLFFFSSFKEDFQVNQIRAKQNKKNEKAKTKSNWTIWFPAIRYVFSVCCWFWLKSHNIKLHSIIVECVPLFQQSSKSLR